VYSTCSIGAAVPDPSKFSVVRLPDPVMMITTALPDLHPGLEITCWITGERSGVRWFAPASPTVAQGAGVHDADAVPREREEMFPVAEVKVVGLSAASA
jgi:hypothetical protein